MSLIANTGTAGFGPTTGINTTGATTLVVALVNLVSGNPPIGCTDNKGNTFALIQSRNGSSMRTQLYVNTNASPTVGSGHTFTGTTGGGTTFPAICVAAFSEAINFVDGRSENSATGTSIQPGSVTPTQSNALLIAVNAVDGAGTNSVDSSFSITNAVAYSGGANFGLALAYKELTTPAANNPTWSWSPSHPAVTMLAALSNGGTETGVSQIHASASPTVTVSTQEIDFFGIARHLSTSQTIPQVCAVGFTIRNWYLSVDTAPGSGKSRRYAIQKNGSDTALVIHIADTATSGSVTGLFSAVHFAAGDLIAMKELETATPAASTTRMAYEVVPDTAGQYLYGYGTASDSPTFLSPFGGCSNAWTLSSSYGSKAIMGLSGTITTIAHRERTAPGGAGSRVVTLYKNGVKQDGSGGSVNTTTTLSGSNNQVIGTFSLPVSPGDIIQAEITNSGSPAASTWQAGTLVFEPNDPTAYTFYASATGMGNPKYYYAHNAASPNWATPEDGYRVPAHGSVDITITGIRAELSAAPGAGRSRTITLRKNSSDTAITLTIADSDTTGSFTTSPGVTITAGDLWNLACTETNAPGSTSGNCAVVLIGALLVDPVVITRPATGITKDHATLRGRIDPNLNDITGYFIWSTDPDNLTNTTITTAIGSGDAFVAYSTQITGLTQDTTYYFRAVGDTGVSPGLFYGAILSFRTLGEQLFVDGEVSHPLTMLSFIDRNGDRHVYAEVDLNDPSFYEGGYKAPWVLKWIIITRGFSDRTGSIEHMVFGATLSDTERFFRALLDDPTNRFLTNRPLWEKMIDDEDRRRLQLWRYVANGYVSDYEPKSPLQFEITGCDWLKKKFSRKARAQRAWQPTITLDDFPTCPKDNVGLAAPLIYGSVADDQLSGGVGPVAGGPVIIPITGGVPGGYWPYSLGIGGPESGTAWAPPGGFSTPNPAIDADHRSFCELPDEGSPSSVPTSPVATAISGGSLRDDWRSATRIIAFMVTAIHSGVESDPSPVAVADLDTYGGERTCRASWTAAAGGADGGYNVYFTDSPYFVDIKMSTKMAPYIVGSNFVRMLHVGSGTTTVDFTSETDGTEHTWDNQYLYTVSAILSDGSESPPSGIILGLSSPYPRPLHLRWLPYSGAIGYRIRRSPVLGVDIPPSWDRTFDVGSTGAFGGKTIDGITQYEFCDDFTDSPPGTTSVNIGTQGAIRVPKGEIKPIYVGDVSIGGQTKPTFLVARGACLNVCRSAFAKDTLIPESEYGVTIFAPGHSGWPSSDPFVDINGRRYSLIQLDGTRASNAIDGTEPLTINTDGFEEFGDGTGDLITSLPQQEKHFVRNFLAPDSPPDTEWLTQCETFAHEPTLTLVDEASFDAVEDIWNLINDGSPTSGIEGAFVIGANGEFVTALEVLAHFHVSGDWNGTFTRKGQYAVSMEPVELPTEPIEIDDVVNINQDSFAIRDQVATEFFNILPYAHTQDYAQRTESGWYSIEEGEIDVRDAASILNYDQERESPRVDLYMLRNRSSLGASAIQITMARKLARYRHPLRTAVLTIPLSGTEIEVGDIFRCTHIEGIGAQGWIGRYVRATRHELDPNQDRVRLEVYDVETLILGTSP